MKISLSLLLATLCLAPASWGQNASTVQQLIQRREQIRPWATLCKEAPFEGTFSSNRQECDHGDLMIFAGLSCLAGTLAGDTQTATDRCRDIELSQGRDGRWWRGPKKVDQPESGSSFSRDQMRGVISYMISHGILGRDPVKKEEAKERFLNWLGYLSREDGNNMCDDGRGIFSSCHLRDGSKNMLYWTIVGMGIEEDVKQRIGARSDLWRKIYGGRDAHKSILNDIEAKLTEKGYPLHLKASTVLFHRVLGFYQHSSSARAHIRRTVRTLEKKDPGNVLFEFLDKGSSPEVIAKVLARCPATPPPYTRGQGDWQWQRDSSEKKWLESNGWDCIYMLNLLIAHQKQTLKWVW